LSVPAIDPLDENFVVYLDSGKLLVVLWLDPTSEGHDKLMDALRPIARGIKPVVDFVWVDATRYSQYVSDRAVNPPDVEWPFFLIYDTQQGDYPIYQSKGIIPELVYLRIHEFLEGELESSLSSAPIPEHQDENIHVVGKNFEEVMFDDSKDVFIEFYSTGCDRCKRLEPAWNSLGNKFAPLLDKITMSVSSCLTWLGLVDPIVCSVKIELPPDVGGRLLELPALKFKPAGSDDFIDHEGDQSLESLIAFVEGNAKNSLEIPEKPFENVEETPVDDAEGTIADDGDAAQAPQSASQP
jgi:protein disulfide-isomerase A1